MDKSSILRIQNYSTVFKYIKNSLNEIQSCLGDIIPIKENNLISHNINLNNNVNIIININNKNKSKSFNKSSMINVIGLKSTKDLIKPRKQSIEISKQKEHLELNNLINNNNSLNKNKRLEDLLVDSDDSEDEYSDFIRNEYKKTNNDNIKINNSFLNGKNSNKIFIKKISKKLGNLSNVGKRNIADKNIIQFRSQSPKINLLKCKKNYNKLTLNKINNNEN